MKITKNHNLKSLNTLGVDCLAKYFVKVSFEPEVVNVINDKRFKKSSKLILGEGSNLLLTKDFKGIVIKNEIRGKKIITETVKEVVVEVGGGENWHRFVSWAVRKGLAGVENLALIPGTVGAASVQNIGAYGQNFSDVFESLEAIDFESGKKRWFTKKECEFGYRTSIFKTDLKNKFIVTKVRMTLSKETRPNTSYYELGLGHASLKEELERVAQKPYTLLDIYKAVIRLRKKRLPDYKKIPNVGSFFVNPVVSVKKLRSLQKTIKDLQYYPVEDLLYPQLDDKIFAKVNFVKVPAGRLLDHLGWRGKKLGKVGISEKHALIVVNSGGANGAEILNFVRLIQKDCYQKLKIRLQSEVCII